MLLILCGQLILMSERSCFLWKASNFSVSDPIRPHVPTLYINTGCTDALYKCSQSCSLTYCLRSQRPWKAVTTSIFQRDRSSMSPSKDLSFLVVLHSSATLSVSRLMIVHSVLSTLTYRNQSPSAVGVISLTLLRYSWSVEMKSASSAYIASLGSCGWLVVGVEDIRSMSEGLLRSTQFRVPATASPLVECRLSS